MAWWKGFLAGLKRSKGRVAQEVGVSEAAAVGHGSRAVVRQHKYQDSYGFKTNGFSCLVYIIIVPKTGKFLHFKFRVF